MTTILKTLDLPVDPDRLKVLGVSVSAVNMRDTVRHCQELIKSGRQGYLCAVDAHSVVEALKNSAHRRALNRADLSVADGMPLVWLGRLRGSRSIDRVYGPDLMLELCRLSVQQHWSHFFYGGAPGIAERLSDRLCERFPGLTVAGLYAPPFRPLTSAEEKELAARVERVRPDLFWVGLGSPKQERFMAEHCGKLQCGLMVGVGAAFDFHSGVIKEAPRWTHRVGLQWAHRVLQEPRRLGRRYLTCVPKFLFYAALELAGMRSFRLEGS
jgi:N-acetylglucosaminyldiphosphoundecaprenol N-acetyl-beta-D-mannosaminyltransferase